MTDCVGQYVPARTYLREPMLGAEYRRAMDIVFCIRLLPSAPGLLRLTTMQLPRTSPGADTRFRSASAAWYSFLLALGRHPSIVRHPVR
jgi:hypothetical protein